MLTTINSATCTTVAIRCKTVQTLDKLDCILHYNRRMGGVDKSDRLLEPYDAMRKCMAWYKKLAIHLLQQSMLNAQIMYTKARTPTQPKQSFLDFTIAVVEKIGPQRTCQTLYCAKTFCILVGGIF